MLALAAFTACVSSTLVAWAQPAASYAGQAQQPLSYVTRAGDGVSYDLSPFLSANYVSQTYRTVELTVKAATPSPADREITFEIALQTYRYMRGGMNRIRVRYDITLPGNAPQAQGTLYLPQYGLWSPNQLDVYVDGSYSKALSVGNLGAWGNQLPENYLHAQILGDVPATSARGSSLRFDARLTEALTGVNQTVPPPQPNVAQQVYASVNCDIVPISRALLRKDWMAYSDCDMICISLADLTQLSVAHSKACETLCNWVAAGGNLWVVGLAGNKGDLKAVEGALGLPPGDGTLDVVPQLPEESTRAWGADAWFLPNPKTSRTDLTNWPEPVTNSSDYSQYPPVAVAVTQPNEPNDGGQAVDRTSASDSANAKKDGDEIPPFYVRPVQFGMLLAFTGERPPSDLKTLRWAINTMRPERLFFDRRTDVYRAGNDRYWNFLIPGVGLAPVHAFWVLITLFVVGIGPVNYWFLRRVKRLQYLLLTTPLTAAAVTCALFAYAMIADGLNTRVRAQSVTMLDQRTGQASNWARLSYFAGLAPRNGLKFSQDVCLLPYYDPSMDILNESRAMVSDDPLRFESGWLPSRTPRQFIAIRARHSPARLEVQSVHESDSSGKNATAADSTSTTASASTMVVNHLGTRILKLWLRNGKDFFAAADISADARATLRPTTPGACARELSRALTLQEETMIAPDRGGRNAILVTQRNYYANGVYYAGAHAAWPTDVSRLSAAFGLLRLSGDDPPALDAERSYVAIVERSPEIEFGIDGVQEQASFHVILGRW